MYPFLLHEKTQNQGFHPLEKWITFSNTSLKWITNGSNIAFQDSDTCDTGFRTSTRWCTRFFRLALVTNGIFHVHLKRVMQLSIVSAFCFYSVAMAQNTSWLKWQSTSLLFVYFFPEGQRKVFCGRMQVQASINRKSVLPPAAPPKGLPRFYECPGPLTRECLSVVFT